MRHVRRSLSMGTELENRDGDSNLELALGRHNQTGVARSEVWRLQSDKM